MRLYHHDFGPIGGVDSGTRVDEKTSPKRVQSKRLLISAIWKGMPPNKCFPKIVPESIWKEVQPLC